MRFATYSLLVLFSFALFSPNASAEGLMEKIDKIYERLENDGAVPKNKDVDFGSVKKLELIEKTYRMLGIDGTLDKGDGLIRRLSAIQRLQPQYENKVKPLKHIEDLEESLEKSIRAKTAQNQAAINSLIEEDKNKLDAFSKAFLSTDEKAKISAVAGLLDVSVFSLSSIRDDLQVIGMDVPEEAKQNMKVILFRLAKFSKGQYMDDRSEKRIEMIGALESLQTAVKKLKEEVTGCSSGSFLTFEENRLSASIKSKEELLAGTESDEAKIKITEEIAKLKEELESVSVCKVIVLRSDKLVKEITQDSDAAQVNELSKNYSKARKAALKN